MDAPTANANGTITPTLRLTRTAASSGATKLVFRSPRSDSPQEGEARLRAWAGQGTTSRPHVDDQDLFPVRRPTYAALEMLAAYVYRHLQSRCSLSEDADLDMDELCARTGTTDRLEPLVHAHDC